MIAAGEATPEQIDASIVHGFGRATCHHGLLSAFSHGRAAKAACGHFLEHFDPAVADAWTRLPSPPITPELTEAMVAGCARLQGERTMEDLATLRDKALVGFLTHYRAVTATTS